MQVAAFVHRTSEDMHEIANRFASSHVPAVRFGLRFPVACAFFFSGFLRFSELTRLLLGILEGVDLQYGCIAASLAVVRNEEDIVAHAGHQAAHLKVWFPVVVAVVVVRVVSCPCNARRIDI